MSIYMMERGWQEHALFRAEEYNRRNAWVWMIEEAAYEDGTVPILGTPHKLERGQFSASLRFMAEKFGWSVMRVRTFLEHLDKWHMVQLDNSTGQNIVTICNYAKYQDALKAKKHRNSTEYNTAVAQEHHSSSTAVAQTITLPTHPTLPTQGDFDRLWEVWKPYEMDKGNKPKAQESFSKALNSGVAIDRILKTASAYCTRCHKNQSKTQHLVTWLNQSGWLNDYGEVKRETGYQGM